MRPLWLSVVIYAAVLVNVPGCSSGGAPAVSKPVIDASAASEIAVRLFDANGDGAIDKNELAKCQPLLEELPGYDSDGDGNIVASEISDRLMAFAGPASPYADVQCYVSFNGRPLVGASVKLRPVGFLSESIPGAEGVTDDTGIAHPTISSDRLPPEVANAVIVCPGLYHVEITHPRSQIPARYNSKTELGWEVDPSIRSGASARFDLKGN